MTIPSPDGAEGRGRREIPGRDTQPPVPRVLGWKACDLCGFNHVPIFAEGVNA